MLIRFFKRYRTAVLGVVATAMLVSASVNSFGVPLRDMLEFLLAAVLGLGIVMGVAFVAALLLRRLKG